MDIKRTFKNLLGCGLVVFSSTVASATLEQQRQDFLLAERLLAQDNGPAFLSLVSTLMEYPLYPYLQYQWLKNNLTQTDKILAFLSAYKETRYAGLLREKWLAYLAENTHWLEFIHTYQASDGPALECHFYWANYQLGRQQFALEAAKQLWTQGNILPKACDPLLSALLLSPVLTPDLIWQRFEWALSKGDKALASHIQRLLDKPTQAVAETWLQIHDNPGLIQDSQWLKAHGQQGPLFAHGVARMAKSDLDLAISLWDAKKPALLIDQHTAQQLERELALALAHGRDSRAYFRLDQVLAVDAEVREWKVRAALFELNWPHVAKALADLTAIEQQQPQWQYWQARALVAAGNMQQGLALYQQLSAERSFYGFLAADIVNKPYTLTDTPVALLANDLEMLAQQTDFKVIQELTALNRTAEAKRQWWFALKKLSKAQLRVAAKLAQQWQWEQVAIMTLVKADYWDDLALRFPVSHFSQVQANAYRQGLDQALVFGLMRQESMLDPYAQSAVGAKGLMQLMPGTARQIAKTLNEAWQADNRLFDPDVNIKYGTFYYKQLLDRFDGHVALAAAAYNAGPNRVVKWLPSDRSVPADVWIETIPYKETRKYVSSVLAYTIIYQRRLQKNALKLTRLLLDVRPR